jgi:rare lipoprotein A
VIPFPAPQSPRGLRRWRASILGALTLAIFFFAGCSHRAATANVPPPPAPSATQPGAPAPGTPASRKPHGASPQTPAAGGEPGAGYVEEGIASWYGFPFQGRRASDGEIYDMNQMTAAHRTLPFNTIVRVTNLRNGLQTEVRIIDRGPFVEGRIIDLSLAAAKALDMVPMGTAPVRLELVSVGPIEMPAAPAEASAAPATASVGVAAPPTNATASPAKSAPKPAASAAAAPAPITDVNVGIFAVQIGAFTDAAKANKLRAQLTVSYPSVSVQEFDLPTGTVFRVFVGRYTFEAAAQEVAEQLQAEHGMAAYVVRVDPKN